MKTIASLIIPTHNRWASLKKMLQTLELQSWPLTDFEVIIVADGCTDNTAEMVSKYHSGLRLCFCELPGLGAASARNEGASLAKGHYLIFADDDMELSTDFIKEHLAAHVGENRVVIGYSPFKPESGTGIQKMILREWWEEKFQKMRKKDHRFRYDDLTSGNFSIAASLFKKVNGFNTSLLCREDYELGYRLIRAGAEFHFAYEAKAIHRDEVTNLRRSLQRKKSEGLADMQIKKIHPEFVNREAIFYLSQRSLSKSVLIKTIQVAPSVCDFVAAVSTGVMDYFEKFKMHIPWLKMNYRLHQYWYLRGLMQAVSSSGELHKQLSTREPVLDAAQKPSIDLQEGFNKIGEILDRLRPLSADIYYGNKFIGTVPYDPGAEPIRGYHFRKILKDQFLEQLAEILYPAAIFGREN